MGPLGDNIATNKQEFKEIKAVGRIESTVSS